MDEAGAHAGVEDPRAACLATVDGDGIPDARIVIVREVEDDAVVWCTSLVSAKAAQLDAAGAAAVVLFWEPLARQVRLRGPVERIADDEADARFAALAPRSRLAAWASDQRGDVADRDALVERFARAEQEVAADPPRPPWWGGHRLRPDVVELWQGDRDRLHDRLRYDRGPRGWAVRRLLP
jgi:pyridoxamine 5'-phosphate oxidase